MNLSSHLLLFCLYFVNLTLADESVDVLFDLFFSLDLNSFFFFSNLKNFLIWFAVFRVHVSVPDAFD